ncbi:MFS transporter [Actinomadura sp. 9N407]|uniref:MFS transporter n=1 Tax=Actinomadura sp. 9N407 TaxID=3375154 RepID=UPI0037A81A04
MGGDVDPAWRGEVVSVDMSPPVPPLSRYRTWPALCWPRCWGPSPPAGRAAGSCCSPWASTSRAMSVRPSHPRCRGRAIAVVTTGFTAATALGAPIGTVLGGAFGWRATVWFLVGLAILGIVAMLTLVPRQAVAPAPEGLGERLRPLRDPRALALMGTTLIGFTAVYIPYTYISAIFEPATGGDTGRLALLLLVFGVIGTVANYAGGTLADRLGGRAVASGALVLLAAAVLALLALGLSELAHRLSRRRRAVPSESQSESPQVLPGWAP